MTEWKNEGRKLGKKKGTKEGKEKKSINYQKRWQWKRKTKK